jgi:hypothetical protein
LISCSFSALLDFSQFKIHQWEDKSVFDARLSEAFPEEEEDQEKVTPIRHFVA